LRASRPPADSTKPNIPRLGHLPSNPMSSWKDDDSAITPRPTNSLFATTPGLAIGVATPGAAALSTGAASVGAEEGSELKKIGSGNPGASGDYFSSNPPPVPPTPADKTTADEIPQSPSEPDKDAKSSSLFGKKFKMNMSFPKKLSGRPSVEVSKPPVAEDTKSEESDDKISEKEDKIVEDSFYGIIQKIHNEYEETLERDPDHGLAPGITPSMPNETPVLKLPPFTSIIIQEDKPESGGIEDLYRGTVECVGKDASIVEKVAPMWLGDLLLRNQTPIKDIVKVSFILMPYQASLPGIAGPDGNSRLNANRMLRAKKILGYVSERIDPVPLDEVVNSSALKPEDYLELYCQNQLIPPNMTLATIRAYVWKTGGDVVLYYKSNGRKPELEEKFAAEKAREAEAQNGVLRDGGGTGTATAAVATVANP
jgi:WD repeat-containing protein 48